MGKGAERRKAKEREEKAAAAVPVSAEGRWAFLAGLVLWMLLPFAATPRFYDNNDLRLPWFLTSAMLAAFGAGLIAKTEPGARRLGAADFAALAMLAVHAASLAACRNLHEALNPSIIVLSGAAWFLAVRRLPPPLAARVRAALRVWAPVVGGLLGAYGLFQFAGREELFGYGDFIDWAHQTKPFCRIPITTFANMNIVTGVFPAFLFVAGVGTIHGIVRGVIQGRVLPWIGAAFSALAAVLLLLCLAVSNQRGWVLGVGAGTAAVAAVWAYRRLTGSGGEGGFRIPVWALAMMGAVLVAAGGLFWKFGSHRFSKTEIREEQRFGIWRDTLNLWRANPALGVGPGNYVLRFPEYQRARVYKMGEGYKSVQIEIFNQPHNGYLHLLVESGPGMLLALLAVLGLTAWAGLRAAAGRETERRGDGESGNGNGDGSSTTPAAAWEAAACLGAAGALAAAGLVFPLQASLPIWSLLWMFLGIVPDPMELREGDGEKAPGSAEPAEMRRTQRTILTAGLLMSSGGLALVLLPFSVTRARASVALHDAFDAVRSGSLTATEAALNRAKDLDPDDWVIYYQGSQVYATASGTAKTPEAVRKLRESALVYADATLRLAPQDVATRLTRAGVLSALGRPADARADLAAAKRIAPGFFMSWYLLANLSMIQGNPAEALPDYAEAARIEPRFLPSLLRYAVAQAATGRPEEARRTLAEARRQQALQREEAEAKRRELTEMGMAAEARRVEIPVPVDFRKFVEDEAKTNPFVKNLQAAGRFNGLE